MLLRIGGIWMRKIALILALVLMFCSVAIYAQAKCEVGTISFELEDKQYLKAYEDEQRISSLGLSEAKYEKLKEYVQYNVRNCINVYNLTEYDIPLTNAGAQAIYDMACECPEQIYLAASMKGRTYDNQHFSTITFTMNYTVSEATAMVSEMNAVADSLTADLHELNDVQKALLAHDRLIVLCEYDKSDELSVNTRNAYGALIEERCVCMGYAKAYKLLMDKLGVECYYCDSSLLNHQWNIVEINGKEYHVDCTWDDPVYDVYGRVSHTNFLRSTNGIVSTGHHEDGYIDYPATATDTTYDTAFWQNSKSAFIYFGGVFYYLLNSQNAVLKAWDGNDSHTDLLTVNDVWQYSSKGYWANNYSHLACDGVELFYSDSRCIYAFDTKTHESTVKYELTDTTRSIYGLKVYGDDLFYIDININTGGPNFGEDTRATYGIIYQYEKKQIEVPQDDILIGDINQDTVVNEIDRNLLMDYLLGKSLSEATFNEKCADIDKDGKITQRDRAIFSRYLANWEGYSTYFG